MKLEVGKSYKLRNGRLSIVDNTADGDRVKGRYRPCFSDWEAGECRLEELLIWKTIHWNKDGAFMIGPHPLDIVEEVVPEVSQ